MRYSLNHRWGDYSEVDVVTDDQLDALLSELGRDIEDVEHPDLWITDHESGWSLLAFAGDAGLVVLEDEAETTTKHLRGLSPLKVRELYVRLTTGQIDLLHQEDWQPGYV
ncbi:hypothetical protein ABT124_47960 [Streptomyces sp. NPDC001982]|uniref:hypothetical protein n=1 Tax=Streptomyces sp. NPDC001982 TaxID=3154405 RepID=UPI003316E9E6